ncbi:MAG: RNA polymerase sigma factor region1.1 domain-containing protein [Pseudomonadota bacterium]|jgi:hypothetical protein
MDDVVRRVIRDARILASKRGSLSFSELNALLSPATLTAEQIGQVLAALSERDIQLVDDD